MEKITFAKLQKLKFEILDMDIWRLTYPIMAKEFINKLLGINAFALDFQTIVNECNQSDFLKIDFDYRNEADFYMEFCKNKIGITDEPTTAYFILRNKVIEKIKEIELRIVNLTALKSKAKNFVPELKDIENYKKNYSLIKFYINKNKNALKDLKEFLITNIEKKAINMALQGIVPAQIKSQIFFGQLFPHENDWLDLDAQSILLHRYSEIDIPTAQMIFKYYDDYLDKKSNKYVTILKQFLAGNDKYQYLENLCQSHHLLNKRKLLIDKCIKLYQIKEYLLTIQLIPTVIEGIINDICLMFEIDKDVLYQYGLTQKIIFIQSKHKSSDIYTHIYSLDYFRNFFPAIRNHMSHGWADNSEEIEVLAGHLVLDLISACEMTTKASYKMNIYVDILNKLVDFDGSDFTVTDKYLTYIKYLLSGYVCDTFYKLSGLIDRLNNIYFTPEFCNSLVNNLRPNQDEFNKLCRNLSQILEIAKQNNQTNYIEVSNHILKAVRTSYKEKMNNELKQISEFRRLFKIAQ